MSSKKLSPFFKTVGTVWSGHDFLLVRLLEFSFFSRRFVLSGTFISSWTILNSRVARPCHRFSARAMHTQPGGIQSSVLHRFRREHWNHFNFDPSGFLRCYILNIWVSGFGSLINWKVPCFFCCVPFSVSNLPESSFIIFIINDSSSLLQFSFAEETKGRNVALFTWIGRVCFTVIPRNRMERTFGRGRDIHKIATSARRSGVKSAAVDELFMGHEDDPAGFTNGDRCLY